MNARRPPATDAVPVPYRGRFGAQRPSGLGALALPPDPMPSRQGLRPLKAWRYVGVFGPELMLCIASVRVGPARQSFWAVWERATGRLYERTRIGRGPAWLHRGRVRLCDGPVALDLELAETAGVETVCRSGRAYAWTRKQGGIRARGTIVLGGVRRPVEARAVIDDTAAYYERHTRWRWSAGVGYAIDGRELAWNLVQGVNDPPRGSERTIWIDGEPIEASPAVFAADLTRVGGLRFRAEATRQRDQNLILLRSSYRQPFGTFAGRLAEGLELAAGYGVMEAHDARW